MDLRPEMYPHPRADVRLRVRANAAFRVGTCFARGRVRNLSAGGVEIARPSQMLPVGTEALIKIKSKRMTIGPLRGKVVRETDYGIAFRFIDTDHETRAQIYKALQAI